MKKSKEKKTLNNSGNINLIQLNETCCFMSTISCVDKEYFKAVLGWITRQQFNIFFLFYYFKKFNCLFFCCSCLSQKDKKNVTCVKYSVNHSLFKFCTIKVEKFWTNLRVNGFSAVKREKDLSVIIIIIISIISLIINLMYYLLLNFREESLKLHFFNSTW